MAEVVITADDVQAVAEVLCREHALEHDSRFSWQDFVTDAQKVLDVVPGIVDRHTSDIREQWMPQPMSQQCRDGRHADHPEYIHCFGCVCLCHTVEAERNQLAAQIIAVRDLASRWHTLSAEMLLNTLDRTT